VKAAAVKVAAVKVASAAAKAVAITHQRKLRIN